MGIESEAEFRAAINGLDAAEQRQLVPAVAAHAVKTARSIAVADGSEVGKRKAQYQILNDFMNKRGMT